ncbi:MAG: hemerythrin domain-containing protein [Zoogloeaceae bacterium]|jgi:hemerythrin-like metal-binding protein|nr:hemerythrin domain-containing protein [Zoogloeaceae bacterium]
MEWKTQYVLGMEEMDRTHRVFVDFVSALAGVEDGEAAALLEKFVAHTEAHFAQENRWMAASAFPPIACHVGEHQRVLEGLAQVLEAAKNGNPGLARVVAREMETWFNQHSATMDKALAWHMQQTGFDPIMQMR